MLLRVDSLKVAYDGLEVLHGIDFEAREGITALVGPNGAGKTTTLGAIAGVLPLTAGSILFDGTELARLPAYERVERGISLVPEGRRLFSNMTVLENLLSGAFVRSARSKIHDTLSQVSQLFPILKEREKQLAGTLSGGEQQMLAIARGLMSRPRLLLLDEPSLGLAPMMAQTVFELVKQIAEQGIAVVLVEQNLVQALRLAKRAYVLEQGRIVSEGEGAKLAEDPHVKRAYLGV